MITHGWSFYRRPPVNETASRFHLIGWEQPPSHREQKSSVRRGGFGVFSDDFKLRPDQADG
jgi:hypothetical protein